MNAEFNWWLLIVGLVVGAGLVWLVLADTRRREADVADRERAGEARWIAETMRAAGRPIDDRDAVDILRLHEAYLAAPPPDELDEDDADEDEAVPAAARRAMAHPLAPGERPEAPLRDG